MKPLIDFTFSIKLLMFGVDFLEFDGDFFFSLEVGGLPDFSESAVTELFGELVVFCNDAVFHVFLCYEILLGLLNLWR